MANRVQEVVGALDAYTVASNDPEMKWSVKRVDDGIQCTLAVLAARGYELDWKHTEAELDTGISGAVLVQPHLDEFALLGRLEDIAERHGIEFNSTDELCAFFLEASDSLRRQVREAAAAKAAADYVASIP